MELHFYSCGYPCKLHIANFEKHFHLVYICKLQNNYLNEAKPT